MTALENYETLEIEIIAFEDGDVITDSDDIRTPEIPI